MIGKLTGTFEGITSDGAIILEVAGVGYAVRTPLFSLEAMRIGRVGIVSLFIHTAVREDAIDLYGFPTEEELAFFKQLTSVSGIGPKTALGILNLADVKTIKESIIRGDTNALIKVVGIGKKSAERVVVELRDKLANSKEEANTSSVHDAEVIEALLALGYRTEEARQALKTLTRETTQPTTISERVAAVLKILGTRASV